MAADSIEGPARSAPTACDGRQRGERKRAVTSGGSGSSRCVVRQGGQDGGAHRGGTLNEGIGFGGGQGRLFSAAAGARGAGRATSLTFSIIQPFIFNIVIIPVVPGQGRAGRAACAHHLQLSCIPQPAQLCDA